MWCYTHASHIFRMIATTTVKTTTTTRIQIVHDRWIHGEVVNREQPRGTKDIFIMLEKDEEDLECGKKSVFAVLFLPRSPPIHRNHFLHASRTFHFIVPMIWSKMCLLTLRYNRQEKQNLEEQEHIINLNKANEMCTYTMYFAFRFLFCWISCKHSCRCRMYLIDFSYAYIKNVTTKM